MRSYITYKTQTIALRRQGKTYTEIQETLGVKIPKSTLSDWCCNVEMPKWYAAKIESLNASSLSKALKSAQASRMLNRDRLARRFTSENLNFLSAVNDDYFYKVALAFLHLGEGAKLKSHRGLMLGSSSPHIIQLYLYLLEKCYGIDPATLKVRVCYRADQNIRELETFWSKVTSIPLRNFYKTKPDARTVGKLTKDGNYKGVCVIMGRGVEIQQELELIPGLMLDKLKKGR